MASSSRSQSHVQGKGRFGVYDFGQVSMQVLESDLSAYAILVFCAICILARYEDELRITSHALAKHCAIARSTTRKALIKLEMAGLIEHLSGGEGRTTIWKINRHHAHVEAAKESAPERIEARRKKKLRPRDGQTLAVRRTDFGRETDTRPPLIEENTQAIDTRPTRERSQKPRVKGFTMNGSQEPKVKIERQKAVGCDLTSDDWARLEVKQ